MFLVLRLSLFLSLQIIQAVKSINSEDRIHQCSPFCFCVYINPWEILAQCNVTGVQNRSLESRCLFGANFSRITELDLSRNSLQHLETKMLRNLTRLTKLNLGFNDMRSWHGNVTRDLPNLVYLNVTGNQHWLPSNDVLKLPKLREIYGVWWRKECGVCSLAREESGNATHFRNSSIKQNKTKVCKDYRQPEKEDCCEENEADKDEMKRDKLEDRLTLTRFQFSEEIQYGQLYRFTKQHFTAVCDHKTSCEYYELSYFWDNARLKAVKNIAYVQYLLGGFAVFINLVVIVTVIVRDKLRASPSFILIAVLAVSDLLTGLYSTLQANFTSFITFHQGEILSDSTLHINTIECNISGYIFTTAQVTSPMTSLFLTVERYLVIVYGLNPEKRLTRKAALLCSSFVWIVAMVIAAVPFTLESVRYNGMSHCTLPNIFETDASRSVRIAVHLATGSLLIPYVIGIVLYQRMHAVVKNMGQKIGRRADSKVAKKIALIVFSNLIFFIIPTVLLYIHANLFKYIEGQILETLTAHKVYFFVFTSLPLLFFNVNACLNPFLFALRNDTFKQQLKGLLSGIYVKCRKIRNLQISTNQRSPRLKNNQAAFVVARSNDNKDIKGACDIERVEMKESTKL